MPGGEAGWRRGTGRGEVPSAGRRATKAPARGARDGGHDRRSPWGLDLVWAGPGAGDGAGAGPRRRGSATLPTAGRGGPASSPRQPGIEARGRHRLLLGHRLVHEGGRAHAHGEVEGVAGSGVRLSDPACGHHADHGGGGPPAQAGDRGPFDASGSPAPAPPSGRRPGAAGRPRRSGAGPARCPRRVRSRSAAAARRPPLGAGRGAARRGAGGSSSASSPSIRRATVSTRARLRSTRVAKAAGSPARAAASSRSLLTSIWLPEGRARLRARRGPGSEAWEAGPPAAMGEVPRHG